MDASAERVTGECPSERCERAVAGPWLDGSRAPRGDFFLDRNTRRQTIPEARLRGFAPSEDQETAATPMLTESLGCAGGVEAEAARRSATLGRLRLPAHPLPQPRHVGQV